MSERRLSNGRDYAAAIGLSAVLVAGAFGIRSYNEANGEKSAASPSPTTQADVLKTPTPSEAPASPSPSPEPSPTLNLVDLNNFLSQLGNSCGCESPQPSASSEPSASPEPVITPEPTKTPEPTSKAVATPEPTPKPTPKSTPTPAPVITWIPEKQGAVYSVPLGQKVLVDADITVDGTDYFDNKASTGSADVIIDGKAHKIKFPFPGRIGIFSKSATLTQIKDQYNNLVNKIKSSGRTVDQTNLNELKPKPQLDYWLPNPIAPGGEYDVPAGQWVVIPADVQIDGNTNYDSLDTTASDNVITDEKAHKIIFPYGGSVEIITPAGETIQHAESLYGVQKQKILDSGKTLDLRNLVELPQ